jgi:hypothetical protein
MSMSIRPLLCGLAIPILGCTSFPAGVKSPADPAERMQQLLNGSDSTSESRMAEELERNWFTAPPLHLDPQRIHGGIQ